jgi:hypothetical protein
VPLRIKPPPQGGGFRSGKRPGSFSWNESISESESILAGKFCVNAIAPIARPTLSRNAPMFLLMSCFVPIARIVPRIEIVSGETIFR